MRGKVRIACAIQPFQLQVLSGASCQVSGGGGVDVAAAAVIDSRRAVRRGSDAMRSASQHVASNTSIVLQRIFLHTITTCPTSTA